ncbi:MAG: XrtA/PEP-CTERM system exopolysaccharide export protein [Steroidobacteraceae bacterium]
MNIRIVTILLMCSFTNAVLAQAGVPAGSGSPPSVAVPVDAGSPAQSVLSPEEEASYIIGPGDQIQVFVWRNPELSTTVPVRPDGKISTPLVNDLVAVGKTPAQLSRDIEKILAEYIRSPQVSVILLQARSVFSEVRVVGEVARPQAVPYRSGMTVLDVVLTVGGLNPFAAGNRSKIVRKEGGKDVEIRVKLEDLLNDGDMSQNVAVKPGDVLVVPQSRW